MKSSQRMPSTSKGHGPTMKLYSIMFSFRANDLITIFLALLFQFYVLLLPKRYISLQTIICHVIQSLCLIYSLNSKKKDFLSQSSSSKASGLKLLYGSLKIFCDGQIFYRTYFTNQPCLATREYSLFCESFELVIPSNSMLSSDYIRQQYSLVSKASPWPSSIACKVSYNQIKKEPLGFIFYDH